MNRIYLVALLFLLLVSCAKKTEPASGSDSILARPVTEHAPEAQPKVDTLTGLLIDQSRIYTPEQQKLLARFEPEQVVKIYHDFKQVRKPGITQSQVDAYIKEKKITTDELKAILEEGDRRGWNK